MQINEAEIRCDYFAQDLSRELKGITIDGDCLQFLRDLAYTFCVKTIIITPHYLMN